MNSDATAALTPLPAIRPTSKVRRAVTTAVLGQVRVDATTNEHKAALRLLGILPPLDGAVVTADALFTHRDVCAAIRERGGDYLLPAKDNQARLQADIRTALEDRAGVSPLPATAAA